MNVFENTRICVALIILTITSSCAHDPTYEPLEKWYIEYRTQGGKRVFPGETINVSLKFRDMLYGSHDRAKVEFIIAGGGGTVSEITPGVSDGNVTTVWTPGIDLFLNVLRADLYRADGQFLTSRILNAYCFTPGRWNKIAENPETGFSDIAADTVSGITLAISGGKVFRQGQRYYQWNELTDPMTADARSIDIDPAGVFYISTWNGNIVKSHDHGQSWTICARPYPEIPYFVYFTVSNDGYLWAGRFDSPSKFSKDGGATWLPAGENFPSSYNGNVFRMKNGAIVCHGSNKPDKIRLQISYDDGLTWTLRETPGYSTNMYVNENDEILIGTQQNGYTFYMTNDMGLTYQRLFSVYPKWGTTPDDNLVHKWKNTYYIGIPGYGVLFSSDLKNFETIWSSEDIWQLFLDHEGTLIARSKNHAGAYYYRDR